MSEQTNELRIHSIFHVPRTDSEKSDEPLSKIPKLSQNSSSSEISNNDKKLEDRLSCILICCVCLDSFKSSIYQCTNGHLMCSGCLTHLLTDARFKDDGPATCPTCRCELSRQLCIRNLFAEKVLSQLPIECLFCQEVFLRCDIDNHEKNECQQRPVRCTYSNIGCSWEGPFHELEDHVKQCFELKHPNKTQIEIFQCLKDKALQLEAEKQPFLSVISVLSLEKVNYYDLQFKPYKTDEISPKLYFETPRFNAFYHQWVLKARVNDNQKDPNLTMNRYLSYQLILKSKLTTSSLEVKFFIIKSPSCDVNIMPKVQTFEFTSTKSETDYFRLGLESSLDCNKLLASKVIDVRLYIFQG